MQLASGTLLAPAFTFFPVYLKDLGLSAAVISLVVGMQRMTGLASSLAGGSVIARIGSRRAIVAGQACVLLATVVFATGSRPLLALIWAVSGVGMALNSLAGQSYLMEQAKPAYLGVMAALLAWGWTLGATLGNPAAGALMSVGGYRILTTAALPALATVAFAAIALPRSRGGVPADARRVRSLRDDLASWRAAVSIPAIRHLTAIRFLATFCYGLVIVFVPLQLRDAGGSNQLVALYATITNIAASLLQLAVGRIGDRVSLRAPTYAACVVLAASSMAIGIFSARTAVVFVAAAVSVSAAWSLSTLVPIQVARAAQPAERTRVLNLMQLAWYVAMIAGALVGGLMYEAWIGLPTLVGGAAAAATVVAAPAFFRRLREASPSR